MSRINWKNLAKNIPTRIKIASKAFYEVLLIKDFHGEDTWGETRYDEKQIILKSDLTPKLTVEVFWHECLHAISEEHNVGLTEQQILDLEKVYPVVRRIVLQLEGMNE